ncbi:unnamed protein product [Musa acuminata subsp. malaccensis]|uniref:(wild Malaysian banana) hypothetical protein n=1 Tax=Musa acuminata subsp. malaccensis TaxID=214687 RepID=A0A804K9G9_MUSAM|nr:unnamed protein product [Musa acuminata subsp. malaccensis]
MAKVHLSPKYVPMLTEGGEQEDEETNPFRWMIEGFSTLLNHTAVTHRSGNFAACGFTWWLQINPKHIQFIPQLFLYLRQDKDEVAYSDYPILQLKLPIALLEWHIDLYPSVQSHPNIFAMFVVLDKFILFSTKTRVYVDYSLCLVDQINGKHEKISGLSEINLPRGEAAGDVSCF